MVDWNAEAISVLREMWAAGHTSTVIADKFDCSRNAIIGKLHRLGLRRKASQGRPAKPQATSAAAAPTGSIKPRQYHAAPVVHVFDQDIPVAQRRTLLTLHARECHFIVGDPKQDADYFYCGAPTHLDTAYCAAHHARMFIPPARRYISAPSERNIAIAK